MAVGPEHECRQGRRCKARVKNDEGAFRGAAVERPGTLCHPCEDTAFEAIRELGEDYFRLTAARTEIRSHISGPKISGSSERSIPIRLGPDTLMSHIEGEVLRWTIRITRGEPLPQVPERQVTRCLEILCANLGTLVDLPLQTVAAWFPYSDGGDWDGRLELDGVDGVLRLADLHRRAWLMLGLHEPKAEKLHDPCHVCGTAMLVMDVGESLIKCRNCWNCWDEQQFARLNNPLAA